MLINIADPCMQIPPLVGFFFMVVFTPLITFEGGGGGGRYVCGYKAFCVNHSHKCTD